MLRVEPVERDGEVRIRLVGELDLASARSTEASIRAYACRDLPLVLDLAALTYCDSQGIRMFFNLALPREGLPPAAIALSLVNPTAGVQRVLDIVDLAYTDDVPVPTGTQDL